MRVSIKSSPDFLLRLVNEVENEAEQEDEYVLPWELEETTTRFTSTRLQTNFITSSFNCEKLFHSVIH